MQPQLKRAFHLVSQPDNQSIKQGQHLLAMLKKDRAYPIALLHYMNNPSIAPDGKLQAAIQLKLWCQVYAKLEEFQRSFYKEIQQSIKQSILHACLNFPHQISKTLIPGIVSLADFLFPNKWENLMMNLMISGIQNPSCIEIVVELMEEITKKYTFQEKIEFLHEQIIKVCDEIHDFLKDLTTNILQIVLNDSDRQSQAIILEILMKLFYNLNYQGLHPKYEDNLQHWMEVLKAVIKLPSANQKIFKCKGAALKAILLYANKYKEEMEETIRDFSLQIWQLCSSASQDQQYDLIVYSCLQFFESLMSWPEMKSFFAENIDQLFEILILPNITLNNTVNALFEELPGLYIDYYFRNKEIQTRRSAAIELLRIISIFYNAFQPFLKKQIQSFIELPPGNIHAECILLGLVVDGSTKAFRDTDGCTQLFIDPQIIEYCYHSIAKKSLEQIYGWFLKNSSIPLEKAFNVMHITTLMRFLFFFRIYLPKEELASILQLLATLKSQNPTLDKIIYMSINGFLMIRHGDYQNKRNLVFFFNSQNLRPIAFDILKLIYQGIKGEQFLHEGLTKMFFNLSKTLQESNCQFFLQQKEIIKQMLNRTTQYDFQSAQYLFQAIGYLSFYYIKANSKGKNELEEIVLHFFQSALNTKSDLLNFCLQVLAIFLQLESTSNYQYQTIYQALLLPENWKQQNQSVMSSYIQFISSFITRNPHHLVFDLPAIEVILSKIIQIDHLELFFRFSEAIMMKTNLDEFNASGYMRIVVQGCQALAHSIQGKKAALLFVSKLLVQYNNHVQALNMINNYCPRFYDRLLEANCGILKSIAREKKRKCIFSAICKAVSTGYFVDSRIQGIIFDSLISNHVDRQNSRNISSYVGQDQSKQKKQATYRKIQVFKQFEKPEVELKFDEQELLMMTFKQAVGQRGQILNYVNEKNKEWIIRLSQKYTQ